MKYKETPAQAKASWAFVKLLLTPQNERTENHQELCRNAEERCHELARALKAQRCPKKPRKGKKGTKVAPSIDPAF